MFHEAAFGDGVAPLPLFSGKNRINKNLALVLAYLRGFGAAA
jgi:hypothetical protein